MRLRLFCLLGLGLLAVLPVSGEPAPAAIEPGTVSLTLPVGLPADLGLDVGALSQQLCPKPYSPTLSAAGNCGSGVVGDPKFDPVTGGVEATPLDTEVPTRVSLHLTRFDLLGQAPLATACGSFGFSVRLDPAVVQPPSELLLVPTDGRAQAGVFTGVLRARVLLRLVAPAGDLPPERTLPVALEWPVGGPWALATAVGGASNLLLLARFEEEQWHAVPSCLGHGRPCPPICLAASQVHLDELNGAN